MAIFFVNSYVFLFCFPRRDRVTRKQRTKIAIKERAAANLKRLHLKGGRICNPGWLSSALQERETLIRQEPGAEARIKGVYGNAKIKAHASV